METNKQEKMLALVSKFPSSVSFHFTLAMISFIALELVHTVIGYQICTKSV